MKASKGPGIAVRELARGLALGRGTVRWHVALLARLGLVSKAPDGGWVAVGGASLRSRVDGILDALRCGPSTTGALAGATGLPERAVRYELGKLVRQDVVARSRRGKEAVFGLAGGGRTGASP